MRSVVLMLFLVINSVFVYCQEKQPLYKWPGFVQLNDSVFISEREISVVDYAEYLHIMKVFFGSYALFSDALPSEEPLQWIAFDQYSKSPFSINTIFDVLDSSRTSSMYSRKKRKQQWILDTNVSYLPIIAHRPIVNINRPQALLYCSLRTKAFDTLQKNVANDKEWRLPKKVLFRLPTTSEWKSAASGKLNNADSTATGEIICKEFFMKSDTGENLPATVYRGHKIHYLYNMSGNVAEMVLDSDLVLGGSYLEPLSECNFTSGKKAKVPANNVGFRIVAVIKE